ncbi:hypothetical protein BT69DRAFT_1318132 [Atractiella rhizophila]|nr:hypothetical protein BT69DRAFT_1318132 [Atractiella rhizophila]
MSSSDPSENINVNVEEQLDLAVRRAVLEEVLSSSRIYLTACFALYGWDFILTFPSEYRSIWKAERWTPVRVSFFFNRYWGILTFVLAMCLLWFNFTPKTCDKVHILEPVATTILFLNCEFLLGARVWVLWNRREWVAYFFVIFAIGGTAIQVWSFSGDKTLPLLPGLRGCISVRGDQNYIWLYWVPLLLYDTTATIFMLVPLITQSRNAPLTRLLSTFMHDGILYFIIVSICNLVNVVYFSIPAEVNPTLNSPLTLTFTPIMASRIVLHLRSVASNSNSREGDSHFQGVGRGMRREGDLHLSYGGVRVDVETEINVEKRNDRLEAHKDTEGQERDYRSSDDADAIEKK